jgi:F0F1-type ATP synthase assembly protein I
MTDTTSRTEGNEARTERHRSVPTTVRRAVGWGQSDPGQAGRDYSQTLGRGFELVLTLVVFGAVGWGLDRLLGTSPWFTLGLGLLGFVGISLKLWYGYDLEMREHERGAIWNRSARTEGDR